MFFPCPAGHGKTVSAFMETPDSNFSRSTDLLLGILIEDRK